jgi:aminomethyltransferase
MPLTLLLHGKHGGPDVRYEPLGPWLVPWQLKPDGFADDYAALRRGAGLVDHSTQAVLECRGADRTGFLQRLLTNDIAALAPGAGCRAALLTPTGKLTADLLVLAEADAHWILCGLPQAGVVAATLERYLFTEQVTLTFHERRLAVLALEGPRTMERLAALTGSPLALHRTGDHTTAALDGVPIRLIRRSLTGGVGVWCVLEAERLEGLWGFLGEQERTLGVRSVGWEALNAARIESGEPWFGLDMDETVLLPETGLEAVLASGTKGCYIGQEIVARLRTYGSASKRLMGLVLEGDVCPQPGDRIAARGEEAGRVTSACDSPALGRPIAMGYLKRGAYEPGTHVEAVREDKRLPATVVVLPFLSRQ